MPAAIRDIELSGPLPSIDGLHGFARAMLVLRWRGRVAGRAFVAVREGRVAAADLAAAVRMAAPDGLRECWLEHALEYDPRATIGAPALTATVAICTRERPEDLARALAAVAPLAAQGHDLLVVDNAPTSDASRRIVDGYPRVRYVRELRRGLNAARNRALREARGDIVAFTDDDAVPEAGWLDALLANFGDPRVLCVTGLTLPLELETEAQELFEQHTPFARGFRRRVFDDRRDNPLHAGPVGAGANMALRRSILARVGPFDERLDAGTPTRSGGDHEMFVRIMTAGYRIVYDPAAVSWHRHRRTREELLDTVYGYGVGVYAMWTGMLLERRELGVLRLAWQWFRFGQWPLLRPAWRRDAAAREQAALARAEVRGCLHGPRAWFAARRLRESGA
jgi:GT2 family glycosyltransferase